ncbi:uncharacterized protein LOC144866828 [Branchiostoma floridae x Branchiostoma japonicum]
MREQHTGGKAYKCDQCDYSAAQKSQVDQHAILKHYGAKPFKCNQCDYSAAQKGRLDEHVVTKHTNEKPYMCGECGYRTALSAAFTRHKKTHTGVEPHKNPKDCEYGRVDMKLVPKRKTTRNNEKGPFKCDQCDYSAAGRRDRDQHVMLKHTGNGEELLLWLSLKKEIFSKVAGTMGRKLRHLLIFLLIILKELNMPEADCSCGNCECHTFGSTSTSQNFPASISGTFRNLPKLQELYLDSNQVTMIQSGTFVNLPRLRKLDLSHNLISMIQPGSFANLPQLQIVFLGWNQMTMIQSGTFTNLTKLHMLDLSNCQIKMIRPGAFQNLPKLKHLGISVNKITKIETGTFANVPNLPKLYLTNGQITTFRPGSFTNLPALEKLYLSNNQITVINPLVFVNLSQLQELDLSNNQITTIQPDIFLYLSRLNDLSLSSNQITMIQTGAFVNLPQLKTLSLTNNQISKIHSGVFSNLTRLQNLHLSFNHITNLDSVFKNLPLPLQILDLRFNRMSVITPFACALLPTIRDLKLSMNPWQCDCKMAPFRLNMTECPSIQNQIICDQPLRFKGQKLIHVNPEEMTCEEPTISTLPVDIQGNSHNVYNGTVISRYHWYFKGRVALTAGPVGTIKATQISPLAITPDNPKRSGPNGSAHSPTLPVLISAICGPVAGIVLFGIIILTIWCKRRTMHPPLAPKPNAVGGNTNTGSVNASDPDHQYENIDNQHDQTGQGQPEVAPLSNTRVLVALKPNQIYAGVETAPKDPTSTTIASGHGRYHTGQVAPRTTTESNIHTTCTATTSGSKTGPSQFQAGAQSLVDQVIQGQSQADTESNQNTAAAVVTTGTDQAGQGLSQTVDESLYSRNLSYGTVPTVSQQSSLYLWGGLRPNPTPTPRLM